MVKYFIDTINNLGEFNTYEEMSVFLLKLKEDILGGKLDDIVEENMFFGLSDNIETDRIEVCNNLKCCKSEYTPSGILKRIHRLDSNGKVVAEKYNQINIDFSGEKYTVNLNEKDETIYTEGGMICRISPWATIIPLVLDICICPDGDILHRGWEWGKANFYLHTDDDPKFVFVTEEMTNTVSGLFSGRIEYKGLNLAIGKSVQEICPINIAKEEELIGRKIYLNR